MTVGPRCVDCLAEGVTSARPTPHGGPRSPLCVTHWRARSKQTRLRAAERHVENTYEMPPEDYDTLYEVQGGRCPICRRARGTGKKRLSVDHDHKAGCGHDPEKGCPDCWRGLLCSNCNTLVALYGVEALLRAIHYLTHPPARRILR